MAAMDAEAAAAEIAESLEMDEIPMKLRCSVCSLLAVGAVRMPCCDQNICENCLASLDLECPVCLHANVDRDLVKPNKTLRTTIKAFLKKKVMERDNLRKREEAARVFAAAATATATIPETPKDVPAQPTEQNADVPVNGEVKVKSDADNLPKASSQRLPVTNEDEGHQSPPEAQMDIPRPSIENSNDNAQMISHQTSDKSVEEKLVEGRRNSATSEQNAVAGESQAPKGQWLPNSGIGIAMPNGPLGINGMNGALPMDFGQMMPYMMNGMPNNLMGAFPNMMGMPAIGMDPMAAMTQSMYGGFGGPGMGVNGMNMGMGFNAGQGAFGGFNGQLDTWTAGQDNYNANAYGANGVGGNFGAHAGHGGYNVSSHQGNFNQMHQQQYPNNDFQHGYNNRGHQNRGRGRRGYYNAGRGQGGYGAMNQGNHNDYTNYEPLHHKVPAPASQQGLTQQPNGEKMQQNSTQGEETPPGAKVDQTTVATATEQADEDRMNTELNPGDENDDPATDGIPPAEAVATTDDSKEPDPVPEQTNTTNEHIKEADVQKESSEAEPLPIETFISSDDARMGKPRMQDPHMMKTSMPPPVGPGVPQGPASRYSQDPFQDQGGWVRGSGRGFYRGRGEYRGRGAGYGSHVNGIHSSPTASSPTTKIPALTPIEPKGLGVEGAPTGPKALREGHSNGGSRGGRGFSIVGRAYAAKNPRTDDRPRSRSPSISRHRTRSRSPESSQHRSSHHRSRRYRSRSESDDPERERRKERRHRRSHKYEEEESGDQDESRHRDASAESTSRKSTHRSHRHHHERESGSSSYRHRRDRSRERDREEDRRHRKRRSRSPASVVQTPTSVTALEHSNGTEKEESRKRRERDRDDEDRHRERKRSRRDRSASPQDESRTSHKTRDRDDRSNGKPRPDSRRESVTETHVEKAQPASTIPTGPREPEKDHHTLEREARNRERLMKEMQRRAATEGTGLKRKNSGLEGRVGGRKPSYKYEDEEGDEARAAKVEKDREAARWG